VLVKFVPVTSTYCPRIATDELTDVMVGATLALKAVALTAVPFAVTTAIGPAILPDGAVALIEVALTTEKAAETPLNSTCWVPAKFVPVIFTEVPAVPLLGENEVITGATLVEVGSNSYAPILGGFGLEKLSIVVVGAKLGVPVPRHGEPLARCKSEGVFAKLGSKFMLFVLVNPPSAP
jgi:hypothetical protein